ncbi:SDR family NAD(P)-dependent oxidoreductase [Cytobacillus sp. NCCP-133]|uniref:SDR family NAD(P)-dependent oxidoreductase n=1 Tax=Cytobacillus sp. NCCP-133 TaxID=766848 RepID=UPI00222FDE9F|nr:SDR family NAD(P)-dependent oxidoreductase [Cytobacillus sp. NCCP-133]GLB58721.1 short-chain dehydrogenase [Cytobacillus sp. NCCP-133]
MEKHALIIGGTGMLKYVADWLSKEGYKVSVAGRTQEKFTEAFGGLPAAERRITFIQTDYNSSDTFAKEMKEAIRKQGNVSLCVCWMRSDAVNSFEWLISYLAESNRTVQFYEVKGSRASREIFTSSTINNLKWNRVILGFKRENGLSRWLTDKEISEGVMNAIKKGKELYITGEVEPWDQRPG